MSERDLTAEGIREAREALNMTQTELAARLGVTPIAVRYWEYGLRSPAAHLREPLTAILYGADDRLAEAILEEIRPLAPRFRLDSEDMRAIEDAVYRGLEAHSRERIEQSRGASSAARGGASNGAK